MHDSAIGIARSNVVRYATAVTLVGAAAVAFWPGLASRLFASGTFLPHVFCYRGDPALVWTHAVSDILIGLSYVAISAMLTLLVHRARRDIPFSWIFLAFGMFIVACGATHFMEVLVLWKATYWLSGAVKIVTAVASLATAIVLPPLIPRTLTMVREAKQSEARRIELQEQLAILTRERAARAEAEEANRAKDAFLATISHELRTPMTAVLGWASMIRSGSLEEDAMKTGIAAIEQSARAQAQLIDDLLDVSRIIAGKLALEPRSADLSAVIRSAVQTVSPAAEKKSVRVSMILPPSTLYLLGDAARLHQIVTNLLANAIKFTRRDGRVQVELRRDGSVAEITVTDDGIGIDPEFLPHVFDRFTQADPSSTRDYNGLGLGLAIVRHLVELHGGEVQAKSDGPGKGSTFRVRLPLQESIVAPDHTLLPITPEEVDLAGRRLLVVEDEPLARDMMKVALTQYGADVRAVASVAEALHALAYEPTDVVITDIAMPGEDGFSLLQKLRAHDASHGTTTHVIAVSALSRADERSRILLAGFDDYLQKPVQPVRLAAAVARTWPQT